MTDNSDLIRVAVVFGGRSTEHEISVLTGLEVLKALDPRRYAPIPVYITREGQWYTGSGMDDRAFYRGLPGSLAQATRVILLPVPGRAGLLILDSNLTARERLLGQRSDRHIPVDIFVPALHGTIGEDGCIQGLFEMAEYAYTGCGVEAASIGMNKIRSKRLVHNAGVPVLPDCLVDRSAWSANPDALRKTILATPGLEQFPLFVKPCNLGSSIGISPADDAAALDAALANVFRFDSEAIVEPRVREITEINVSVLEGDPPRASVVEVPQSADGVLTFEEKYMRGNKSKKSGSPEGLASMERRVDPADLPADVKQNAQSLALRAFEVIGCAGVARVDFIFDRATQRIYFNEINTLPGSMSFYLWERSNPPLSYTALLTHLVDRSLQKHAALAVRDFDAGVSVF